MFIKLTGIDDKTIVINADNICFISTIYDSNYSSIIVVTSGNMLKVKESCNEIQKMIERSENGKGTDN
jgi:uncharacterized protein YlzI (FlbEa/FlbD family)